MHSVRSWTKPERVAVFVAIGVFGASTVHAEDYSSTLRREAALEHKMFLQQLEQAANDAEIRRRIAAEVARLRHLRNLVQSTTRSSADHRAVTDRVHDTERRIRRGLERLKREPISPETLEFITARIATYVPDSGAYFDHGTPRLASYPFAQNLVATRQCDDVLACIRRQIHEPMSDAKCRVVGMTLCVLLHDPRHNQTIDQFFAGPAQNRKGGAQVNTENYHRVRQSFVSAPNQFPKTQVVDPTKDYHNPTIDYFFPLRVDEMASP